MVSIFTCPAREEQRNGQTPWGAFQLPGLAAATTLTEVRDSYDQPCALVRVPAMGHFTVVFAADPDGASLVDEEQVDAWVAHWGQWLASLADEPGVVAASVTIETAPDTGSRLRREVESNLDPSAPAVAQAMLREVIETYPAGSATVKAMVAVTFSGAGRGLGRGRDAEEMGRDLAARLPWLSQSLHATGAGAARPMNAQQLCEVIRTAYDPAAARIFDNARTNGGRPELRWSDVGPAAAQASWDVYRHDSAYSVTWSMTQAPRGEVSSSVLQRLLRPHGDVDRKRVTLLYRPIDSSRAARIVEQDKRNTDFRVNSAARPSARALTDQRAASATAQEEARGAGLVNFGMLVTATVTSPERQGAGRTAGVAVRGRRGGEKRQRPAAAPLPGSRGWTGRGRGSSPYVQAADEWRGTTVQVCGLWPFAAGTGSPMIGVPLGRNLLSGATLCADPVSWFQRARLISTPSMFVLGKVGLGKSSLVRRMALGLTGYGVLPMVLGDLKPDYVDLIRALDGQVIELGRGRGRLNILDPGEASAAADRLTGQARAQVIADARGRRHTMVAALITLLRAAPPSDHEEMLLDRAIGVLDDRHEGVPVLGDLIRVLVDAPDELREIAFDRGSLDRYHDATDPLVKTLTGLLGRGRLGEMFSAETTTPMRRDRPVVFDVSSIDDAELTLQRAALMACWSYGFGAINVANALADAGVEPQRHYFVILDELWRALRGGRGMVDRVDALTRLDRQRGVGRAMISHTMSDLQALPDEDDRLKARGFVERSGMVVCAGLPESEMDMLTQVVSLSRAEQQMLISWVDPAAWDDDAGEEAAPPGRGNFLAKVGGRPGIPFHVALTDVEQDLNDTNRRWHTQSRLADVDELASTEPAA